MPFPKISTPPHPANTCAQHSSRYRVMGPIQELQAHPWVHPCFRALQDYRDGHCPCLPRVCQEPWISRDPLPQAAPRGALFTLLISEGGVLIALNYRWKNWSGQQSIRLIYHPVPTRREPAIGCRHEICY